MRSMARQFGARQRAPVETSSQHRFMLTAHERGQVWPPFRRIAPRMRAGVSPENRRYSPLALDRYSMGKSCAFRHWANALIVGTGLYKRNTGVSATSGLLAKFAINATSLAL